jgi:hypothetical protein
MFIAHFAVAFASPQVVAGTALVGVAWFDRHREPWPA